MVRSAAAVVCLLTLIVHVDPAHAQYFGRNKVRYDHLDFRILQTDHFDIYYYPEEEKATRHAARMAERWYARFSKVLHHTFSHRQTLVLYASHPHFGQTNVTASSPNQAARRYRSVCGRTRGNSPSSGTSAGPWNVTRPARSAIAQWSTVRSE